MNKKDYLFGEEDGKTERLSLMNKIFNPYSQRFITEALSSQSGKVLDIGCGQGDLTCWLAKQKNSASVLGIDTDETVIDQAKVMAQQLKLHKLQFKQHSIYDLDQLPEQFHIIHFRFVLMHLTNYVAALRAIAQQLKSGGILIAETAIHSHCFSDPKTQSYDRFIKFAIQVFAQQGKDGDLGKQIFSLCESENLTVEKMQVSQPILRTTQEKKSMFLGFQNAKVVFAQEGIATDTELAELESQMEQDYQEKNTLWAAPSLCQIVARKC